MQFKLTMLNASLNAYGDVEWNVTALVEMDVKAWTKIRNAGHLGQLYGVDISNHIHGLDQNIPAHCPTVDDKGKARKGIKFIRLTYKLNDPERAEKLGLVVQRLKNGSYLGRYGDFVDLLNRPRPELRIVK